MAGLVGFWSCRLVWQFGGVFVIWGKRSRSWLGLLRRLLRLLVVVVLVG